MSTSEGGGNTVDQLGETTMIRIVCCWIRTATAVTNSNASPHHVPPERQSRPRHTLKIRIRLTNGITIPIDFSASVVHKVQRESTVNQIVDSPSTARRVETAANFTGESLPRLIAGALTSGSGCADMSS